jgi:hypothetical protein
MSVNTPSVQEIFKVQYADAVENVVPNDCPLQRDIKFDTRNKLGSTYNFALLVRNPQGHTWNGGATYGNAATLNSPIAGRTVQASTPACEYVLREQISYGMVSRSADGKAAFEEGMDLIVGSMVNSAAWALELTTANGGGDIGAILSNTPGGGSDATIVITVATWAAGNYSAFEGGLFDVYDPTLTTKRNTNGPATLNSVDIDSRSLAVTFFNAADRTASVAGDVLVPVGVVGNWTNGMFTTITRAAAGSTLYGLNTSTYGLLRSGTYSAASGPLTFAKCASAAIRSVTKGGMGPLTVLVSPYAWTDINNDEAANRRYVSDKGGEFVNGADRLVYYGPNGGTLTIMQHPMIKAGEAYVVNLDDWRRIGSSEPTFRLPGNTGLSDRFVTDLEGSMGFQIKRWWDQALICRYLARQVKITNIVNVSGP